MSPAVDPVHPVRLAAVVAVAAFPVYAPVISNFSVLVELDGVIVKPTALTVLVMKLSVVWLVLLMPLVCNVGPLLGQPDVVAPPLASVQSAAPVPLTVPLVSRLASGPCKAVANTSF